MKCIFQCFKLIKDCTSASIATGLIGTNLGKPLLVILLNLLVAESLASGTWIMAGHTTIKQPIPNTVGDLYGWWGTGYYVDMKSIVRNGNLVYYNEGWVSLDKHKMPCSHRMCGWDANRSSPVRYYARILDCAKGLRANGSGDRNFREISTDYIQVFKFLCRGN